MILPIVAACGSLLIGLMIGYGGGLLRADAIRKQSKDNSTWRINWELRYKCKACRKHLNNRSAEHTLTCVCCPYCGASGPNNAIKEIGHETETGRWITREEYNKQFPVPFSKGEESV